MPPDNPVTDHLLDEKTLRFFRNLLAETARDALDFYEWTTTRQYKPRYRYRFGVSQKTNPKIADRRMKTDIEGWIKGNTFHLICVRLGYNPDNAREQIRAIMRGERRDEIKLLLREFEEETHYAEKRGVKPKARSEFTREPGY